MHRIKTRYKNFKLTIPRYTREIFGKEGNYGCRKSKKELGRKIRIESLVNEKSKTELREKCIKKR